MKEAKFTIWRTLKSVKSSAKTGPNYDAFKSVMETISQTEISCRNPYQTDFSSSHRRRQKTWISEGF